MPRTSIEQKHTWELKRTILVICFAPLTHPPVLNFKWRLSWIPTDIVHTNGLWNYGNVAYIPVPSAVGKIPIDWHFVTLKSCVLLIKSHRLLTLVSHGQQKSFKWKWLVHPSGSFETGKRTWPSWHYVNSHHIFGIDFYSNKKVFLSHQPQSVPIKILRSIYSPWTGNIKEWHSVR